MAKKKKEPEYEDDFELGNTDEDVENDGTKGPGGKLTKRKKKNPPGPEISTKHGKMWRLNGRKPPLRKMQIKPGRKGKAFVRSRNNSPEVVAKRQKATQLRYAGFTYDKIGEVLGCEKQMAHELVMGAIQDIRDTTRETASELRAIAHGRLEHMINRLWMIAVPTKPVYNPVTQKEELPAPDLSAVNQISKLMDQDARMMGYNLPEKHTVDIGHLNSQVSIIVEMITRAIPDESREKVFKAVDDAMRVIEDREKQKALDLGPGVVIDV